MNKIIKIKPIHPVFELENIIRIGIGAKFSVSIEKTNENLELISLLQKGTTIEELKGKIPQLNVEEFLSELTELGFIEIEKEIYLSERYSVNLNSYRALLPNVDHFKIHKKICNTTYLVIGMGGIGSHLLYVLAELGIKKIVAIDFDTVELSNLNRQILYSTEDVSKEKSFVGKTIIENFNDEIEVIAIQQEIKSKEDVVNIIEEYGVSHVINVADYPTAEIDVWVNEAVVEKQVVLFAVLIDKHDARGYIYIPGVTPCFNCLRRNEYEENEYAREEIDKHETSKFRIKNSALGAACMFWGYFVGYEIIRMNHMEDYKGYIKENHFIEVDLYTSLIKRSSFGFNKECECQKKY